LFSGYPCDILSSSIASKEVNPHTQRKSKTALANRVDKLCWFQKFWWPLLRCGQCAHLYRNRPIINTHWLNLANFFANHQRRSSSCARRNQVCKLNRWAI
jgi:hypothetical protein